MLNSRNRRSFIDVCHHSFGRKVIYSSAKVIDRNNIVKELGKALSVHWQNREEIDYLDRYYKGDQPILYKTKKVRPEINNITLENHALEFVRFATAQNFGEPMQYVSRVKDKGASAEIDKLNQYMLYKDKAYYDVQIGRWQSTVGTAYRFVWSIKNPDSENGEPPFGIDVPDPRDAFVVYSKSHGKPPLYSVQLTKSEENNNRYCIYTNKEYFEVENGKIVENAPNGYGKIPVIEYPNNEERLSNIEIVITLLDSINNTQSNRMDGIDQFVQAFMKFINCEIDEDDFLKMCSLGAIKIKGQPGVQADVDLISSELDQQNTQIVKDDLYNSALTVVGMPSREGNTGGDTGQAVYLRNGWDFAEQRAVIDEPTIIKSEKEFLRIILHILRTKQKIKELPLINIDIKITRNKTDNMLVKTQGLMNQLGCGINPKIAIETCGLYSDPEKVYIQSEQYLGVKYKTVEQVKEEQVIEQQMKNEVETPPAKGGDG